MLAPFLPDGSRASAWPDLTPVARQLLLQETLVVNPSLVLVGTVDYQSAREPLLLHEPSGRFASLAGEFFNIGAGLTVTITEGTLIGGRGGLVLLVAAVVAVVLLT